jgi:glycosyltransferase involved in cell wall biosynthesis
MRWGRTPCDGEMKALRCAACYLHGLGVPQPLAWPMAALSPLMQHLCSRVPFCSLPLTRMRQQAARHWLGHMNRIVVLCQWGREVMRRNAIPAQKLRVVRHGLAAAGCHQQLEANSAAGSERDLVKLAFFGRLDRTKGLHVLMNALEEQPDLKLELHGYMIADESARTSMRDVFARLQADVRVKLHPPVPPDQVVEVMAGYDAVVVPSVWLETGPLVVLEAFAAGVPVLGSDLGGIPEWVTHEQDGLLVRAGDPGAWSQVLSRFTHDPALRSRLRAGVKSPPTMADMAVKMDEIYREVLS